MVAGELARFLGVLAHPNRVHIVEELRGGERDVNALQEALGISHSGVSQHLALLRAHRLVAERRVGRRVFYRLLQPALAAWLAAGLNYVEPEPEARHRLHVAVSQVRDMWNTDPPPPPDGGSPGSAPEIPDPATTDSPVHPKEGT
jgi:DNA-binding transcriptional ArsR family regulator